ncbi:MAG TPA: hydroxymethylbilane synthase [Gemmatimonadaceae bacterium]|nr:hydroxymethylbilane synthase [Gemmatimonadaceae bacterium]
MTPSRGSAGRGAGNGTAGRSARASSSRSAESRESAALQSDVVRIATRGSELALRQARMVQHRLEAQGCVAELVTFRTTGDRKLDEPLSAIGGKGLFTAELERALAAGKVDCCVHSLKDLPTEMPAELPVVAILEREDPRDVLVVNDTIVAEGIADLPRGSRVGTSSLRRRAQLLHLRADLDVVDLRGNVPTRLRKVDDGQVHAAILAGAGLKRLDVQQRIDAWLDAPAWLPAAGQGAVAVQARADDTRMAALLAPLDHAATRAAVTAERALLAALQGGCQVPIGALVIESPTGGVLHAFVADVRGTRMVRGELAVDAADPAASGARLAAELLRRGGDEILSELRALERVPSPQPE